MDIQKILKTSEELSSFRSQLAIVSGGLILEHRGDPSSYPCIVISDLMDADLGIPYWKHEYIYGLMEDLIEVMDAKDFEETLAAKSSGKPSSLPTPSEEDEWNEFWNRMEKETVKKGVTEEYRHPEPPAASVPFRNHIRHENIPYSSRTLKEVKFEEPEEDDPEDEGSSEARLVDMGE